ncbi:MAG: endonuclease MutS2 [Spirochaetia bacterium]
MERHTVELLEFEKIRTELAGYCRSGEGKELLFEQDFIRSPGEFDHFTTLVTHYRALLESGGPFPEVDFPPVSPILDKLDAHGTVLESEEAARLGRYVRSADRLKNYLVNREERDREQQSVSLPGDSPLLEEARNIPEAGSRIRRIFSVVTEEGEIDESIPELKNIRRRIMSIHREIEGIASGYLHKAEFRGCWQNDVPGQKEGRTVLPLKSSHRGRVQGIVHEVSSSGATLFIEPMEIVEKNNQLTYEENLYRKEVHRILRELTEDLRPDGEIFRLAVSVVSFLDTVYARSRYAIHRNCRPAARSEGNFHLNEARHPLLGESAVPITLRLSGDTRCLVISGPNTGGKTVGLKTAGLFVLMNQYGMQIPAGEDSALPLYESIFADIGDEQSIEYSLSTFSGHMTRISRICDAATDRSLVLLDELGSGTDIEEGAALAMAVLDHLGKKNATTLVTTHQSILKNYAFTRPGADNASVEFDPVALKPLYRIIPGIPGESHALEIAEQVGMNSRIIETAAGYREGKKTDVSRMIEEISSKKRELDEKETELAGRLEEMISREADLSRKEADLDAREASLKGEEATELKSFIRESRKRFENLVRELREGELKREEIKRSKEFVQELEEKQAEEEEKARELSERAAARAPAETAEESPGRLEPGTEVLVGDKKRRGTIVREGKKGSWIVAVGNMKMSVDEEELSLPRAKKDRRVSVDYDSSAAKPSLILDIRGMRYEEAAAALSGQLDQALVSGLHSFEIIHGKGEGVLQKAVQDVLSRHPGVENFRFARPEAGGYGKTIVDIAAG